MPDLNVNPRWYPTFHVAAPAGWINDPNGLSYFQGCYHVFFQHHPYSSSWGPMHWGHVSGPDLVHLKHEPIALAPSLEEDRDGVFSGSAVEHDGKLVTFYTGHRWRNGVNEDEGNLQVQCRATSEDGRTFTKDGVVIDDGGDLLHFRDPKVFFHEGQWFMVFGACSADNRGQVRLYTSSDLENWEFSCVLFEDPNPSVFMLECPDFFPLYTPSGERYWVLLYCPMGRAKEGYSFRNDHTAGYVVGTWEPGQAFRPLTAFRMLDHGNEFYAPQTFAAPDGRRILFAWMGSFTIPAAPQTGGDNWFGQLTIPRTLHLTEDLRVEAEPIAEYESLRNSTLIDAPHTLAANESRLVCEDAGPCEITCTLDLDSSTAERQGIIVHRTAPGRGTYIAYDAQSGQLVVDRRTTGPGDLGYRSVAVAPGKLRLRIFVDRGSVEVFAHDGSGQRRCLSSYSFPDSGPRGIELLAESGGASISEMKVVTLGGIWV